MGYGVKIFLPSPPNYVTRSPGGDVDVGIFNAHPNIMFFRDLPEISRGEGGVTTF